MFYFGSSGWSRRLAPRNGGGKDFEAKRRTRRKNRTRRFAQKFSGLNDDLEAAEDHALGVEGHDHFGIRHFLQARVSHHLLHHRVAMLARFVNDV